MAAETLRNDHPIRLIPFFCCVLKAMENATKVHSADADHSSTDSMQQYEDASSKLTRYLIDMKEGSEEHLTVPFPTMQPPFTVTIQKLVPPTRDGTPSHGPWHGNAHGRNETSGAQNITSFLRRAKLLIVAGILSPAFHKLKKLIKYYMHWYPWYRVVVTGPAGLMDILAQKFNDRGDHFERASSTQCTLTILPSAQHWFEPEVAVEQAVKVVVHESLEEHFRREKEEERKREEEAAERKARTRGRLAKAAHAVKRRKAPHSPRRHAGRDQTSWYVNAAMNPQYWKLIGAAGMLWQMQTVSKLMDSVEKDTEKVRKMVGQIQANAAQHAQEATEVVQGMGLLVADQVQSLRDTDVQLERHNAAMREVDARAAAMGADLRKTVDHLLATAPDADSRAYRTALTALFHSDLPIEARERAVSELKKKHGML